MPIFLEFHAHEGYREEGGFRDMGSRSAAFAHCPLSNWIERRGDAGPLPTLTKYQFCAAALL